MANPICNTKLFIKSNYIPTTLNKLVITSYCAHNLPRLPLLKAQFFLWIQECPLVLALPPYVNNIVLGLHLFTEHWFTWCNALLARGHYPRLVWECPHLQILFTFHALNCLGFIQKNISPNYNFVKIYIQ